MQLLQRPAFLDKSPRQPIEQLRMARLLTQMPEVARRADESASEMILPNAIHNNAWGERIVRAREPLRQRRATARRVGHSRREKNVYGLLINYGQQARFNNLVCFFRNECRRRDWTGIGHEQGRSEEH